MSDAPPALGSSPDGSSTPPRFPILTVNAPGRRADELGARLFELGASGVEVRDETTTPRGPGPEQVTLVASFAEASNAEHARTELLAEHPDLAWEVGEIVGDEWRDKYKEFFKPFKLTETLVVAPPWEAYEPEAGERVLVMDPGRAFGTGRHATTSMVAELLKAHRARVAGARVLDVGTGSGILGLVALVFGADAVVAIDNDPDVIEVAAENAARNGFAAAMHVSDIDLGHVDGGFDVILANIRCDVLIGMEPLLARRLAHGGLLVLSGVLAGEHDDLLRAYAGDFDVVDTKNHPDALDAWVAVALRRK